MWSYIYTTSKKIHIGQMICREISERHLVKEGTPAMGGIIFIIPAILL